LHEFTDHLSGGANALTISFKFDWSGIVTSFLFHDLLTKVNNENAIRTEQVKNNETSIKQLAHHLYQFQPDRTSAKTGLNETEMNDSVVF
jgi:hypothetical protein